MTRRAFAGLFGGLATCVGCGPQVRTVSGFAYGPSITQRFDVYPRLRTAKPPAPLVVLIHGGGWEHGDRQEAARFVPYFTQRGSVVANLGYRQSGEAVAPAAAEDVRNAIQCVRDHAAGWQADGSRLLLVGFSAGAHLALLAALAPPEALGGPQCHPCAVVSFWGVTDIPDLLEGEHMRAFARRWIPAVPGRPELAHRLSPLEYEAAGAPVLCAVHSINDPVVPFAHSERLVARFRQARVPAELIRLSHPQHTPPPADYLGNFREVFRFLDSTGATPCQA